MIYHTQAYKLYQDMLETSVRAQMYKGCGASMNVPFVNAVMQFAALKMNNPFVEGTPASNHYFDLLYFVEHVEGAHDCPYKLRCTTAAMKMLHDNEMQNPFAPEEEPKPEEPEIVEEVKEDPPQEVFGVVPERKKRWNRRNKNGGAR